MTKEEILEAEKGIADVRNFLAIVTGTTDPERLTALVLEKWEGMFCSLSRGLQHIPRTIISGADIEMMFHYPLFPLVAFAEMAQRRPEYKSKLVDHLIECAPRVTTNLDKIAQILKDASGEV